MQRVMEAAVAALCCGTGGRVTRLNSRWRQKKAAGRQTGEPDHTAERQPGGRAGGRREAGSELCTVSVCPLPPCGLAG